MRKVRVHRSSQARADGRLEAMPRDQASNELAYAADRLIRRFGQNKAGRTYALRLIGVYTILSELGFGAFREYGYTRDQAAYFVKRLQTAGLFTDHDAER